MVSLSVGEIRFLGRIKTYKALWIGLIIYGSFGIAIAIYAQTLGIAVVRSVGFVSTPISFLLLGALFLKIYRLIQKLESRAGVEAALSKSDIVWIKKGPIPIKILASVTMVISPLNALVSLYGLFVIQVSYIGRIGALFYVFSSIGFFIVGWLLLKSNQILQKLGSGSLLGSNL